MENTYLFVCLFIGLLPIATIIVFCFKNIIEAFNEGKEYQVQCIRLNNIITDRDRKIKDFEEFTGKKPSIEKIANIDCMETCSHGNHKRKAGMTMAKAIHKII